MSKAPKAPAAPDPVKTAAAQTSTNVSTAIANASLGNVNQITPDGTLTYKQTGNQFINDATGGQVYYKDAAGNISSTKPTIGGVLNGRAPAGYTTVKGYYVPTYTAETKLSDAQQAIKDQNDAAELNLGTIANQQSKRLGDLLNQRFTLDDLPAAGDPNSITEPQYQSLLSDAGLQTSYGDGNYEQGRKTVEDAMYARLNPQIEQQRATLESSLANRGIRVGSAAYASAMDDFNRGLNDQRTSITLAGGQEQSRLAGLDRDRALFGNSAKQQDFTNRNAAILNDNTLADQRAAFQTQRYNLLNQTRANALNERFAERNQPLNEISALMSGSQVSNPNFVSTNMPNIPTVDYAGLVQSNYANQMAAYQQQMQSRDGLLGGILGGISSIAAAPFTGGTSLAGLGVSKLGGLFGR